MDTIKELLASKKAEQERERKIRDRLELAVRSHTDSSNKKDAELATKTMEIKGLKESVTKLDTQLKEEKAKLEIQTKEKEKIAARLATVQADYDVQLLESTRLANENQQQTTELKGWEEELQEYKDEFKGLAKAKEFMSKRLKTIEDSKGQVEAERENLKVRKELFTILILLF
jgi:chromosome segregation ATPase